MHQEGTMCTASKIIELADSVKQANEHAVYLASPRIITENGNKVVYVFQDESILVLNYLENRMSCV